MRPFRGPKLAVSPRTQCMSDHALGAYPSVLGKHVVDTCRDLPREVRWDGVSYLDVLLRARSPEEVVVWKCLEPSSLTDRQTATLRRVWMDEVVAVFRNMTGDSG